MERWRFGGKMIMLVGAGMGSILALLGFVFWVRAGGDIVVSVCGVRG